MSWKPIEDLEVEAGTWIVVGGDGWNTMAFWSKFEGAWIGQHTGESIDPSHYLEVMDPPQEDAPKKKYGCSGLLDVLKALPVDHFVEDVGGSVYINPDCEHSSFSDHKQDFCKAMRLAYIELKKREEA